MIAERFDHFLVGEFEQPRTPLDQRDAHAKRRKHAAVLHADDTAADDDHCLRQLFELP